MKAVILVGGEGTRLRPLTCNIPKAMVPVVNRPFLEHLVRYLKEHGIREIILAMSCLPDPIQSYFNDGSKYGVRITYLIEDSPLGTAGAVKNAEALLDRVFLVVNGDILTEIDLTIMMRRHQEIKPKVSIALTPVDNPTIYGVVETNTRGMVKRFVEKPTWDKVTTNMINAGIYILEPEVLEHVPASTPSMFEHYLFPLLLEMGEPVFGYPSDAYWIDIGTPEKYLKAHHDLLLGWGDEDVRTEEKTKIHPTAQVEGPAVLGSRCKVRKGAVIEGAILWHDSKVGNKAVLRNCVAASHSSVQRGSHVLDNCVLGDNVTVGGGNRLAQGARIWPNRYLEPNTISL